MVIVVDFDHKVTVSVCFIKKYYGYILCKYVLQDLNIDDFMSKVALCKFPIHCHVITSDLDIVNHTSILCESNILYQKSVKLNILPRIKDKSVPMISYIHATPIANKIFNYNNVYAESQH